MVPCVFDENEEIERVQERYLKWVLRLENWAYAAGALTYRRNERYNGQYLEIITGDWPKYLERENGKEKRMIAVFRCGNEKGQNRFCIDKKDNVCRLCGTATETVGYLLKELKKRDENSEEILSVV